MKSFSLKGPAVKAFFGPNALTLGNPFPPTPPPVGLSWTARDPVDTGGNQLAQSLYANGVIIANDGQNVWRSTDDGVTWTNVDTPPDGGLRQITYAGGGLWGIVGEIGGGSGYVIRSTDNGVSWSDEIGLPATQISPIALANNAAGTWMVGGGSGSGTNVNNYCRSTDNGLTWAQVATAHGSFFRMIWDGAQFVASTRIAANAAISTSPTGVVWTDTLVSTVNNYIFGLNFDGANYMICTDDQDTIRVSTTPAGLAVASDTDDGLTDGGSNYMQPGGGLIWVFGESGGVSSSSDEGATWTPNTLNFPDGDSAFACAYDSVNGVFVATGDEGDVSTQP